MSKAFRGVKKTQDAPNADQFRQRAPTDINKRKERLRLIAESLKRSGRNLADANQKRITP